MTTSDTRKRRQSLADRAAQSPAGQAKLFYSISEAAETLDVAAHVLRYWETQFPMLRPRKGRSGSRMYQQRDLDLLVAIRTMLYDDGLTIAGARKKLIDSKKAGEFLPEEYDPSRRRREQIQEIREELSVIAAQLRRPVKLPRS
jgi:DNA-binding transcriptional MerR regulator